MDELNFSLQVKQVNPEISNVATWEENENVALNEVVDANTEFQSKFTSSQSVSPTETYGLTQLLQILEAKRNAKKNTASEKSILELCEVLNETYEVFSSKLKKNALDRNVPQVHVTHHKPNKVSTGVATSEDVKSTYPGITPEVASYLNHKHPDLLPKLSSILAEESASIKTRDPTMSSKNASTNAFQTLTGASDALSLSETLIGNLGGESSESNRLEIYFTPGVSSTPEQIPQCKTGMSGYASHLNKSEMQSHGNGLCEIEWTNRGEDSSRSSTPVVNCPFKPGPFEMHSELKKYPRERITVVTERKSYFGQSETEVKTVHKSKVGRNHGRSASRSSLNSVSSQESSVSNVGAKNNLYPNAPGAQPSGFSGGSFSGGERMTAEQLAWAFRTARDRLDTASNISGRSSNTEKCDLDSNCIDTMSSISDVSGYEEEMFRIRKLLLDPTAPIEDYRKCFPDSKSAGIRKEHLLGRGCEAISDECKVSSGSTDANVVSQEEDMEIQNYRLSVQLQNALKEKEKYESELESVETKVGLSWQGKYHDVLRQKACLEGQLETLRAEMDSLLSERSQLQAQVATFNQEAKGNSTEKKLLQQEKENLLSELLNVRQTVHELEASLQKVQGQCDMKDSEITHYKYEIQENDSLMEKLRIDLEEVRLDMESKESAVQGLKRKIADQHMEFQSILQAKLKAENDCKNARNEINSLQNLKLWYQEQLHQSQTARTKMQQELMSNQGSLVMQTNYVEKLRSEILLLQQQVVETQQRAMKEKEVLKRHLEGIEADMMEREALFEQMQRDSGLVEETVLEKLKKLEEEKVKNSNLNYALQDVQHQLDIARTDMKAKDELVGKLENEQKELMKNVTIMQKMLNEKELSLQGMETKYKNLEDSYNHISEILKSTEEQLSDVKNEKIELEVALASANKEKEEIDGAIGDLKEKFAQISSSYQKMKSGLLQKEKENEHLLQEIKRLEVAKAEQAKELVQLQTSREDQQLLQAKISTVEKLEQQMEQLRRQNKELGYKIADLTQSRLQVHEEKLKLEETLAFREQQLWNQHKSFEVYNDDMSKKEQVFQDTQKVKSSLENSVKKNMQRIEELELLNKELSCNVECLNKELNSANQTIMHFNDLCRGSEEEKEKFAKELKQVKEELQEMQTRKSKPESELGTELELMIKQNKELASQISLLRSELEHVKDGAEQSSFCERMSHDNDIHLIKFLLNESELKIMSLLSDSNVGCVDTDSEGVVTDEQKGKISAVPELQILVEKLRNMSTNLTTALELKKELMSDVQGSKQEKMNMESELSEIRQERERLHNVQNSLEEKVQNLEIQRVALSRKLHETSQHRDVLKHELQQVKDSNMTGLSIMNGSMTNGTATSTSSPDNLTDSGSSCTLEESGIVKESSQASLKDKYSEQICLYQKEIENLKTTLKSAEKDYKEKHRRYESNIRILLRKLKEHMKERKKAEKELKVAVANSVISVPSAGDGVKVEEYTERIRKLEAELKSSQQQYEEQRKLAEMNEQLLLEVEKEKGKLAGIAESHCVLKEHTSQLESELARRESAMSELGQQTQEMFQKREHVEMQAKERLKELEEEVKRDKIIIKDIRKEVFTERRVNSHLKKQISSLKVGLETANQLVDAKKQEISWMTGEYDSLQQVHMKLQVELETARQAQQTAQEEMDRLKRGLEESRAKDPVLADQLKTLSCHLHQKSQELLGLQEQLKLAEGRWEVKESGLQRTLQLLQDDVRMLSEELESTRKDKFMLQSQVAELQAALRSSLEHSKVLKLRLAAYEAENKDRLPDLTSSLPSPAKYDETVIAELLKQSTVAPQSKPLNNLQCCLNSLKQEMATLQKQLTEKTSHSSSRRLPSTTNPKEKENTGIQNL